MFPNRLATLTETVCRLSQFYDDRTVTSDRPAANIDVKHVSGITIDDEWFIQQVSGR